MRNPSLVRGVLILVAGFVLALPIHAQTSVPDEETVRRIVENAMAAVSLAEARAAQAIAKVQVDLDERDSEIQSLRARLQAERDSAQRQAVLLSRSRIEIDDLRTRHDALHLRTMLLEKAIEEERLRVSVFDTAQRQFESDKAALEERLAILERERVTLAQEAGGYRVRSAALEESVKLESARAAGLEAALGALEDSSQRARGAWDAARIGLERERNLLAQEVAGYKARSAALEESLKRETVRAAELERSVALLHDSAGPALLENERLMAELTATRGEIVETIKAVEESAAAIRLARAERDSALTLLRFSGVAVDEISALRSRLEEKEREIAALRAAFLSAPGTPPSIETPPVVAVAVPPPVSAMAPPLVMVAAPPVVRLIDFDRASYEDLAAVEEIGPTRARALVWFRENVRPIRSEDDLKSVPGFNDERIELLRAFWRPKENEP